MTLAYFLELDGISGGATAASFKNQIEVTTFSVGVNVTIITSGGGGGSAGRPSFSSLTLTKPEDVASTQLFVAASTGKHFAQATITAVDGSNVAQTIFHLKLSDVLVSGFHLNATPTLAEDTVILSYSKLEWFGPVQNPLSLNASLTAVDVLKNIKL